MKAVLCASLMASASAFVMRPAPVTASRTAGPSVAMAAEMSKSMPFLTKPKNLDGYVGSEAQFDPFGFAEQFDIKWLREAEVKHCRTAMLATVGYTFPEIFPWIKGAFAGEAYQHSNPLKAVIDTGASPMLQIILAMGFVEWNLNDGKMTMADMFSDKKRVPGDFGFDPMGLSTPENKDRYQMAELQNGRLAMIAIGGMIHQTFVTGEGVFGSVN